MNVNGRFSSEYEYKINLANVNMSGCMNSPIITIKPLVGGSNPLQVLGWGLIIAVSGCVCLTVMFSYAISK